MTGALALTSYAVNNELSRVYLIISMQVIVVLDLVVRFALRKRLHHRRLRGECMSTVVAVGHEAAVSQLIKELRREPHHGLKVVAACLAGESSTTEVAGVPVVGDLDDAAGVVRNVNAGTVAVLSCPEMDGVKLRALAWELEKTGTDLCVAPGAARRGRPADHGPADRRADPAARGPPAAQRAEAGAQGPVRPVRCRDGAHDAFTADAGDRHVHQVLGPRARRCSPRRGWARAGELFKIYKFRTMVVDAEARLAEVSEKNDFDGVLFKIRKDPRVTASARGCASGRSTSCRS